MPHDYDDDDDHKEASVTKRFKEFDCPGCNANNPVEEFGDKAELTCNYCGMDWLVRVSDEGKMKFKEL